MKKIGVVTRYYPKISVAVVALIDSLAIGDKIHIKGEITDFPQTVTSIQIEHEPIQSAKKGQKIGLKVDEHVREDDELFKT